jgi:hypothetical protein
VVRLLVRDSRVISSANIDSLARLAYEYGKRRVAKMLMAEFRANPDIAAMTDEEDSSDSGITDDEC